MNNKHMVCMAVMVGSLSGCASKHLVYVQDISFGLTFGVSAEGTQKLSLGYDRDVYSVVPKKGNNKEAMSLFSINNVEVEGLDNMTVSEFVAGGEPAKKLAKEPNSVNTLRTKVYGN